MDLSTRTTRRRLPRDRTIRWSRLARGRSLGYRRPTEGAGTWYVRVDQGPDARAAGKPYRTAALGTADDLEAPDGDQVLSYREAVEAAGAWTPPGEEPSAPFSVADAVARYLDWYRQHRRAYREARYSLEAHVLPELGEIPVSELTADRLRAWHEALAEAPARLRGRKGDSRRKVREALTEDQQRARKSTANRVLAVLKAALNRAWEDGRVESREAWQRVKPFRGAGAARAGYLDREELRRLLNSCPPDFRDLVAAAVYTGARYAELGSLVAENFRPEAGAVYIPKSKSGNPRYVYLGAEGLELFERLGAGKAPSDPLLVRSNGKPWTKNEQARPMAAAVAAAKLPPTTFHQLRHTYASLYLMAGGSLVALAKQLGHSTTRMVETHYGHLADSWRAEEATRHAPSLGLPRPKVAALRRPRPR